MARHIKTAQDIYSSGLSMKELRRQYSWRSYEARKKLERLRQKYGEDSAIVQENMDRYRPLSELGDLNRMQLSQQLSRTYDFGGSKTGQLYEDVASKMKSNGFTGVNLNNVGQTLDFLDDIRAKGMASIYGSEGIIEVANRAARQGLSDEEWKKNLKYWEDENKRIAEENQRRIAEARARGRKPRRLLKPVRLTLQKRFRDGGSNDYRKRK